MFYREGKKERNFNFKFFLSCRLNFKFVKTRIGKIPKIKKKTENFCRNEKIGSLDFLDFDS